MPSFQETRSAFIAAARRAVSAGLQVSTGGNLSARVADRRFLVKPSGFSLAELEEADLLVVDASGDVVEGSGKPTKEIRSHLGIYLAREDVGAVVHYHPPYSTAYAVCGREIPLKTVHARRILGRIPLEVAIIDLLAFGSLPSRDRQRLLRAALSRMTEEGLQAAMCLRGSWYAWRQLAMAGFYPVGAEYYYNANKMQPGVPLQKVRRLHVLWR